MKYFGILAVVLMLALFGCSSHVRTPPLRIINTLDPDPTLMGKIWSIKYSVLPTLQDDGYIASSFCIGDNIFLSARHVVRVGSNEQIATMYILGDEIVYPEVLASGDHDEPKRDWVLFRAELDNPARPLVYDPNRDLAIGEEVLIFGYPSASIHFQLAKAGLEYGEITPEEMLNIPLAAVEGRVADAPLATRLPKWNDKGKIQWVKILEPIDISSLGGVSGGPACILDENDRLIAIGINIVGHTAWWNDDLYLGIIRPELEHLPFTLHPH